MATSRIVSQLRAPSLRQRFLVAPLLGLVLLTLLTAAFTYELERQNALLTHIVEEDMVAFERSTRIFIDLSEEHVGLFDLLNSAPQSDEETLYDNAKQRLLAIHDATRKLRETVPAAHSGDASAVAQRGELLELIEAYRRAAIAAVEMTTLNVALAPREITLANQRFGAMNRAFEKLLDAQLDEHKQQANDRIERNRARTVFVALGGISLAALLLVLSVGLSRLLSRSLEAQIRLLGELGDPAQAGTEAGGGDEVERISRGIAAFRRTQIDLRESEKHFRAAFDQAGVGMALRDVDPRNSRWLRVNQKLCDILGYTREELLQLTPLDLTSPEDRDLTIEYSEKMLRGEITSHSHEKRYVRKDGRIIWANITLTAVSGPDGRQSHIISVIEDITGRKEAEENVKRLSRVRAVMSGINSAIVRIQSRQALFDESCRIAVEHGGFGMVWIGLFDPRTLDVTPVAWAGFEVDDEWATLKATARDIPEGRGSTGWAIRGKRPVVINDMTLEPALGGARRRKAIEHGFRSTIALPLIVGSEVVGVFVLFAKETGFFNEEEVKLLTELASDISFALEHMARQEKVEYLSYYDSLTGLPNRQLFSDRLSQQMRSRSGEPLMVALVLLNIERFRNINETLGRHGGDELLKLVARRLESMFHGKDYLARIGADGFGVVIRGVRDAAEIAHAVENQVLACFKEPFAVNPEELRATARAGVALFPVDGGDADTLYKNAEAALKQAKASGERYLFYQQQMNARVMETLLLENKMRRALEKEEFILHYQPKLDLGKGTISGLEALIRWNDPESGLVPPIKFIPLLEETGMILDAGRWAIRKALEDYREWHARGLQPPRIAVNVSPIQLRQKDFVDVVRDAIGESPAGSHGLDLEITESLIMEDIEGNIAKLRAVRDMGVNISIDDFGTGYSSLGYLAKLPVNALKIDRSFIIKMTDDSDSMTIVSTIISLAHSLKLKVIAEGVDAEDQRKFLRLLRCDEMQGYLFSKPLPAAEIEALLRAPARPAMP